MNKNMTLEQSIEYMMKENVIHKPLDYTFRRTTESYPKSSHIVLELPGIFQKIETPTVFTQNGKSLQQDIVESALPDNKTLNRAAILNLEHMSYPLYPGKAEIFYLCKNSTVHKYDKPCFVYLITNIDYKSDEIIFKKDDDAFSIKIIYISQDKIDKTLNTISLKDYSKEEISEVDFIHLIHCLIFTTKKEAQRIVKKVAEIFVGIKKIKPQHHLDLFIALKTMIKYRFKDDKNKQRELLKMIAQTMTDKELEEITTFEYRYNKLEDELKVKDKFIEERDQLLEENGKLLQEKEKEIEELKAKLNGKVE